MEQHVQSFHSFKNSHVTHLNAVRQNFKFFTLHPAAQSCVLSEWSEWSTCSAECGFGKSKRTRAIITPGSGAGPLCPDDREQEKECYAGPCGMML